MSLSQTTAVILAGGFGARVRHLLPNLPKPMAPAAGRPFLEWVVRYLAKQGIGDVIISTGYLAEVVTEHFRCRPVPGVNVQCVAESEPLGTAGGFLNAARAHGGGTSAWLVLNGDSLVFADLRLLSDCVAGSETDGALLGLQVADSSRYGSFVLKPNGEVARFVEKQPGARTINAGVYLLSSALVDKFPARHPLSFERDVFPGLIERGARLRVVEVNAPFLDIGTEETLSQAEPFIRQNMEQFKAGE